MALTAEQSNRLLQIRSIINAGTGTPEERKALMIEGVTLMRGDRKSAHVASSTSRTKSASDRQPVDTGGILAALKAKGAALQGAMIPPTEGK